MKAKALVVALTTSALLTLGASAPALAHPFHRGHEHLSLVVVGWAFVLVVAAAVLLRREPRD